MDKIHKRYEKARALAERGATEGERQAAQAAMERMEAAHPELVGKPIDTSGFEVYRYGAWASYGTTTNSNATNIFVYTTAV